MDRLEAMRMLVATAENGSLSAASRALLVPLATLSRNITELERHVGTTLILRSTRHLSFTDAGIGYVEACRNILKQFDEANRAAAGEFEAPKGDLVITAPLLFGERFVIPLVADFLALHPEINVRLALSDRNLHLLERNVDLAVRIGALPDSMIFSTRLGAMRTVVCASTGYLSTHGTPTRPAELSKFDCITHDFAETRAIWQFAGAADQSQTSVSIRSRLAVSSASAAVEAAVRNVGLARLLFYQMQPAMTAGELRIVLEDYECAPEPVSLLYAAPTPLPLKTRTFLDYSAPRLRSELKTLND